MEELVLVGREEVVGRVVVVGRVAVVGREVVTERVEELFVEGRPVLSLLLLPVTPALAPLGLLFCGSR